MPPAAWANSWIARSNRHTSSRWCSSNSLYGKHGGPYDPGTLFGLLFHLLGGGSEAKQGFVGHVMGGMGAITQAMAAACGEKGVEIRTASPVQQVSIRDRVARQACCWRTARRSTPRIVVSNADPKRTFLELVDARELDPQFRADVRGIKMDGPCGKLNLVLDEEPRLSGGDPDADKLRNAQFTLVPWLEGAQRCYESARQGKVHERLWIDCLVPSLLDPSLVTPGRHVMTCFVQYLPGKPAEGWETAREPLQTSAARAPRRTCTGSAALAGGEPSLYSRRISKTLSASPRATSFTATCGRISCFSCGPLPAHARYATPIRALYLCGAGTHPGGGVTGAPGFNAAHRILSDLPRERELRKTVNA